MLEKLYVENYALIDKLELELSKSLNIITGETGAGKSILLGALGLLLGNRCDASSVKDQERNCVVEGEFEIGGYNLEWFFDNNDLEYDAKTIVRRVITPGGKSRAYINDLPVQVTTLKEFGSFLIDIHSQHQSLKLSEDSFRIGILDSVAGHKELLNKYSDTYHSIRYLENELERMRSEAESSRRDEEWLKYQTTELASAKLSEDEAHEMEESQNELSHAEEIKETLTMAAAYMDEEETGILIRLKTISQALGNIKDYYPRSEELAERIQTTLLELRDIEREINSEGQRVDSDPVRLQIINDRLNTIYSLQQKHNAANVSELIALQKDYESRLAAITVSDEAIAETEVKISELKRDADELAVRITKGRQAASMKVTKHVEEMLKTLGMPDSVFVVEISRSESLKSNGMDNIRFLFSANKDIAPAPVEKIASGGEISRLMLAIKSIVAQSGNLPTIIFDEIDTGVSGRIADAMGNIMNSLSANMQVVNITHLPQVASKGETHFYVYKDSEASPARTMIRRLSPDERVDEIAKMISGKDITEAALLQARLLLGSENLN